MNLFELQERLKDFSQEQLVREMQAPTGSAPQFLVLSELQRRQRMMAEEQAQMQTPQTTVAEDAIAAAGVPQGGLADMARAMAPQTDMDMNTAVQPVERMQEGGSVDGRDSGFIRRLLESVGERARNSRMTDEEIRFLRDERPIPKRLIDALNPGQSAADARDSYEEGDYPGAVINAASAFPLGKIAGPAANVLAELYSRAGDRELEPVSEFPIGMADGGVVRMQPGGEVEGPNTAFLRQLRGIQNTTSEMQARNAIAREKLRRMEAARRAAIADRFSFLNDDLPVVDEFGGLPSYMTETGTLADIDPTIDTSEDYDDFDYQRALDEAARMRELNAIPFSSGPLADVTPVDAREDEGPYTEALRSDIERQRRRLTPDDYQSRGETDPLDPRSPSYVPPFDTSGAYSALLGAPSSAEAMFGDIGPLQGPMQPEPYSPAGQGAPLSARPDILMDLVPEPDVTPFTTDSAGSSMLSDEELAAITGVSPGTMRPVQGPNLPSPSVDPSELGGLPDFMKEQGGTVPMPQPGQGIMPSDIGRAIGEGFGFGPAMDAARETLNLEETLAAEREAAREAEAARMMEINEIPATARKVTDEGKIISSPQPKKDTDSGGTGGGAGASAPAGDDAFEQDKWLALAQAGLALMSSQQPTIGGAIGEAGLSGITALRQARTDRDDRIERQQARADRLAAAARKDAPGYEDDAVGDLLKQRELLEEEASRYFDSELGAVRPGYEERYNRIFQRIDLIDSAVGAATISRFPGLIEALTEE
jgi:hypothetical protein